MLLVNSSKVVEKSQEWLKTTENKVKGQQQKQKQDMTTQKLFQDRRLKVRKAKVNRKQNCKRVEAVSHHEDHEDFERQSLYLAIAGYFSHVIVVSKECMISKKNMNNTVNYEIALICVCLAIL